MPWPGHGPRDPSSSVARQRAGLVRRARARAGAALLLALLGCVPGAPAAAAGEPEWVRVEGDLVVGAPAVRAASPGTYERLAAGDGFIAFDGHESGGSFTIRLGDAYGTESLRPYLTQAAREVVAATGMSLTVAPGVVAADRPLPGEILFEVSSTSPCEGAWSGCGGPRTSYSIAGRSYWSSGQAWIHPNALSFSDHNRQHVVSHELGHTLGLRHYDEPYGGETQVMHSTSFQPRSYRAGDRAGLLWLRPDPPGNDHLANAAELGPETSALGGGNGWATAEPGEPYHAGDSARRSVWYRWTAPRTGSAEVTTNGSSFAARLAVYAGSEYPSLEPVGSHDGRYGIPRVAFYAMAGRTYSIAVDSHNGIQGSVVLHLVFGGAVANDDFEDAEPLPAHGGTLVGSNAGTDLQEGEPPHDTTVAARASSWFAWTAPRTARVSLSTRGSSFDTVLAVYTGPSLYELGRVANNDDHGGQTTSRVTFDAKAGTTYRVAVAGYNGATGSIRLYVDSGIDRYTPVVPARIHDSRSTVGWGAGETRWVEVLGRGPVPAAGVSAVVLNVTVTRPSGGGFVTVWPSGSPRPHASHLNFAQGQTVANSVQVKVGPDGRIGVYASAGTHVLVDVAGYTRPDGENGFEPAPVPSRLLDSRRGLGTAAVPWGHGETRAVVVAGRGGVPATGVAAVVLNVTAVSPTNSGYVTAWPSGSPRPVVSNLSFPPGGTVANLVVAKVGAGGAVALYNSAGRTHLVADVVGWYSPSGRLAGSTGTPARILDSRSALAWGQGETRAVPVSGRGGVPAAGATAVVLNVTAVAPTTGGYLALWPAGQARPTVSTVNFARGANVPNLAVVRLGSGGAASLHNALGRTHVVADVAGWFFQPPPLPA